MSGCPGNDVGITAGGSALMPGRLVFDGHLCFGMKVCGRRFVNHVHHERLGAGGSHHELKIRRHENGNVFTESCSIAAGCDFALSAENVKDLLLALKARWKS